jgi:hypothetical protein
VVAGLWGFAEATLFFIVPDLFLTFVAARRGLRKALFACGTTLAGALAGGIVMFYWGAGDPDGVLEVLAWVPAIDGEMLSAVREALDRQGYTAPLFGPLQGIPYKIYAAQAAEAGLDPLWFLLASVPARLPRFILASLAAALVMRVIGRWLELRARLGLLSGFWILFYLAYFIAQG